MSLNEIRTPLTAIIGYLETIQSGAINNIEETKKFNRYNIETGRTS